MAEVILPDTGAYRLRDAPAWPVSATPATSRVVYAAAHVVSAAPVPGRPAGIDWENTMAFRHHLWQHGLAVADAMDTAQRGAGLDWPSTRELIHRSGAEARAAGQRLACGAGTDQLPARDPGAGPYGLPEIIAAYEEQLEVVEQAGAVPILMASRALAAAARDADDYRTVYATLLGQASGPVILHWLGDMFDPALHGYWGTPDLDEAAEVVLGIIRDHTDRVDGIKVSLLDAGREIALRRALPGEVRLYTGDDFHYPELIAGDAEGYSHALLGIFDAIAAPAGAALRALDDGDLDRYHEILAPTVPLARHIFMTPTYHYKTGIVFLAWLAGHQPHFRMVAGAETTRDRDHLIRLFQLADAAGVLPDPDLAAQRMSAFLAGTREGAAPAAAVRA